MLLRFPDPALEREFSESSLLSRLFHIRVNSLAGITLIVGFIYFDYQFVPPRALEWSLSVRLFLMVPMALLVLAMSFYKPARDRWQLYPVIPLTFIGVGVAVIIAGTQTPLSIYYMTMGIIQYEIFAFFLLGLQFSAAMFVSIVAGAAFLIAAFALARETVLFVLAHLVATTVVLALAKWHNEYQERQLFLANRTIRANEKSRARADQAKIAWLENLSGFLHHEIKNAFLGARTSLTLLQKRFGIDKDDKHLVRANASIDTIKWHLDKVRDVTSLERSLASDETECLNLDEFVRDHLEDYRNIYPGNPFSLSLEAGTATVCINAERFRQLLDKLISNAIEHGEPGTPVELSSWRENGCVVLSVVNSGPPLPEPNETLFDLARSGRSVDGNQHMGLGLYIVKSVAEYHGGRVRAANLPGGKGVEFTVALPVAGQTSEGGASC